MKGVDCTKGRTRGLLEEYVQSNLPKCTLHKCTPSLNARRPLVPINMVYYKSTLYKCTPSLNARLLSVPRGVHLWRFDCNGLGGLSFLLSFYVSFPLLSSV